MQLEECLIKRRSVRSYIDKELDREIIKQLIDAAILAPSWKNSQVSRYYVIDTKENKLEFLNYFPQFNQESLYNASAYIVSTIVKYRSGYTHQGEPETHLGAGWQYFDNGLQIQNICLKATELGLATLVVGIYDENKIRQFLNIPDTEELVAVVAVGYSNETPDMPRRKQVEEITKFK